MCLQVDLFKLSSHYNYYDSDLKLSSKFHTWARPKILGGGSKENFWRGWSRLSPLPHTPGIM
jgi:hypothetical protein